MKLKNPKSILIIRLSSIGDIILTFPTIVFLRNKYPESKIDIVVDKKYYDILLPIEKYQIGILLFDKKKGISEVFHYRNTISVIGYDWIVDLQGSQRSWLMTVFMKPECFKLKKKRIRRILFVKLKIKNYQLKPVSKKYLEVLPLDTASFIFRDIKFNINQILVQELMSKIPVLKQEKTIILVYPGAKHNTKCWPLENYNNLILKMADNPNRFIIISGDANDQIRISKMNCLQLNNVSQQAGSLSLKESWVLTSLADFVISNDSAPMHMAALFQIKQISIWGSTVPQFGFAPDNKSSFIIENTSLSCRPCSHIGYSECPKNHFKCMRDISVELVYKKFTEMI